MLVDTWDMYGLNLSYAYIFLLSRNKLDATSIMDYRSYPSVNHVTHHHDASKTLQATLPETQMSLRTWVFCNGHRVSLLYSSVIVT